MASIVVVGAQFGDEGKGKIVDLLAEKADLVDNTVFNDNSRGRIAGLRDVELSAGGFWNASSGVTGTTYGKIDPVAFRNLGSSMEAITILPNGTGLGDLAYTVPGCMGEYTPGGSIGDMLGFSVSAYGINALARGKLVMRGLVSTNWGGANTSTGQNIGVATTKRRIVTGIHVLESSGAAGGAAASAVAAASAFASASE